MIRRIFWSDRALACAWACSALLGLAACVTPPSYRTADRSRFEAIAPEVSAYWAADPKLDAEQRDRRFRLLRAWDADSAGLDERQNPVASK